MAFSVISPETGRGLFFLAAIVFVGWFAAGTLTNVRKGNAIARWMQDGLPLIGEKTTLRWMGSSGIELKIQNPRKPFLNVEIFILLEPRDVPFLWAYFHWRGRRDILILRCESSSTPRFQLEARDSRAWSAPGTQQETSRKLWSRLESPAGVQVVAHGEGILETATKALALAAECELPLVRLAVRRYAPQLEVHWQLRRFGDARARGVFETLLQIHDKL